jgi:hypothetical protein
MLGGVCRGRRPVSRIGQVVSIGSDLKRDLEMAAQDKNRDSTGLARRILREWLAARPPK